MLAITLALMLSASPYSDVPIRRTEAQVPKIMEVIETYEEQIRGCLDEANMSGRTTHLRAITSADGTRSLSLRDRRDGDIAIILYDQRIAQMHIFPHHFSYGNTMDTGEKYLAVPTLRIDRVWYCVGFLKELTYYDAAVTDESSQDEVETVELKSIESVLGYLKTTYPSLEVRVRTYLRPHAGNDVCTVIREVLAETSASGGRSAESDTVQRLEEIIPRPRTATEETFWGATLLTEVLRGKLRGQNLDGEFFTYHAPAMRAFHTGEPFICPSGDE